ncbi:MAG: putative GNAT family N-acyltransferase [Paracoccaceae bacterium]|jgi:predicted GNAT family N-acyltransferase
MTEARITEALNSSDLEPCYAIRIEVFCGEQQVSRELEFDGLDAECRHYLARIGDDAVGTARVRPLGDGAVKFERVAVCALFRGQQVGRALMDRALADALGSGAHAGVLHAQSAAAAFYLKLGFAQEGGTFVEAGIPHIRMTIDLKQPYGRIQDPRD